MSRTIKKNPDKVCPRGRRHCRCCAMLGYETRTKRKDERRDAGRSEERDD